MLTTGVDERPTDTSYRWGEPSKTVGLHQGRPIRKRVARWGEPFKNQEVSVVSLRPLDGSCSHLSPSLVAANPQSLGHQALCIREALGMSWEDLDSPFIRARQAEQRGLLMQELRQELERGA